MLLKKIKINYSYESPPIHKTKLSLEPFYVYCKHDVKKMMEKIQHTLINGTFSGPLPV